MMTKKKFFNHSISILQPAITVIILLILWEVVILVFKVPEWIFTTPTSMIEKGIQNAPKIWPNFLVTLREALIGYFVAIVIGIPTSLIIAYSTFAQRTIYPGMVLIDMIPKVAFAPLIVAWLGFGLAPKIVVTFLVCFFPIIINGILGFRSISPEIVYLTQTTGSRAWETFWKIRLPNALPYLFVGLKYSGSAAMVGAVVAEFIGGNKGLGYYLIVSLDHGNVPLGLAIMVAMTSIGLGLFFGMGIVESLVIPWHISQRASQRK